MTGSTLLRACGALACRSCDGNKDDIILLRSRTSVFATVHRRGENRIKFNILSNLSNMILILSTLFSSIDNML